MDGIRPNASQWTRFDAPIQRFLTEGFLEREGERLRLTDRGVLLSNEVFAEFHLMIDLRSDTVTRPTAAMRRAMVEAEVGDDVYREDPTVNRLERRAAEILGKEAAVFVPTGTMGNTVAIKIHTQHGQEVICESRAHILDWELAMTAWFSGCVVRPIQAEDGILRWDAIREFVRRAARTVAPTGLIELENTHNMAGGRVYPLDVLRTSRVMRTTPAFRFTWMARASSTPRAI